MGLQVPSGEVWKKYIEDQKPEEPDDNFKVV
jgi:putative transposase